mgnify:CR=1 FL=1
MVEKAFQMKHPSLYLDWYVHVPERTRIRYDFRSSGLSHFKYNLMLGEVDLSTNYVHGNPENAQLLAQRYHVQPENVFVSSEGASGQNARIIRCLAERNMKKNEAIVEYPTYEPLLRQVQEHFPYVKRLERREREAYRLDADSLRRIVSKRTGLLVLTNPHAPSGAISNTTELKEIMNIACEYGFYVLSDEIYAEFQRDTIPTIFSIDPMFGIVTTSFTKAYGLAGLKVGIAIAEEELVDELYLDTLNTIGNSANIVETITARLLKEGSANLERHKQKWTKLKNETEKWLNEKGFEHFPNSVGVTYWVKLPIKDTYKWINEHAIPHYSIAPVPGAFFLFKSGYKLTKSKMIRIGLGNINPDEPNLIEALNALERAINTHTNN